MSSAQVDPHDKMRSRDVNKVARGEQAPRPAHEYGTVSPPPPPSSTYPPPNINRNNLTRAEETEMTPASQPRHCYASYVEYLRCVRDKGKGAPPCNTLEKHYLAICPTEWIERWDDLREHGAFPPI